MKFYLETNALRKFNSKFSYYSQNSFTSAFAIVELISGLKKKDFFIRKKVIENLFKSNIKIEWKLPHNVIADAFTLIDFNEQRINDLKSLCTFLINSVTLEDFENKCNKDNIRYGLKYFEKYNDFFSRHFVKSTIEGNIKIQEIFNEWKELNESNKRETLEQLQKDCFILNCSFSILAFAKFFANQIYNGKANEEQEEDIYNSYTRQISFFIDAFSFYSVEKMIQGSQPDKNDLKDLYHFVYLRNDSSIQLLTDDKLLLGITEKLWKDSPHTKATILVHADL